MTINFRKHLIAAVTFFGGLYFFLEFLLPETFRGIELGKHHDDISQGVQAVGAMAIGLGVINILRVHGGRFFRLQKDWLNSLALLIGFFVMMFAQGRELWLNEKLSLTVVEVQAYTEFVKKLSADPASASAGLKSLNDRLKAVEAGLPETDKEFRAAIETSLTALNNLPAAATPADFKALQKTLSALPPLAQAYVAEVSDQNLSHKISKLFEEGFFVPLGSAMFALLAFYIASAAYRSFRVRSVEAAIMMLTALIVILGQIPFGPIYISDKLPDIRLWLINNVSTPAFRAIFFGSSVAGLVMAVRMWLSLERIPLMDEEFPDDQK